MLSNSQNPYPRPILALYKPEYTTLEEMFDNVQIFSITLKFLEFCKVWYKWEDNRYPNENMALRYHFR